MHDILEGVAQYELKLLFLFVKEHVTLEELNLRIQSFDYGFMERNNRPVVVNLGEANDLGLNAVQSWCLLRNAPLLFGDLVTPFDQHWGLLLLLLHIVNLVFPSMLSQGMLHIFKTFDCGTPQTVQVTVSSEKTFTKAPFSYPLSPLHPENWTYTS